MCCILCFCYATFIIFSGWVSILYKWSKSADLQLSLHASRALVNLDRDEGTVLYPSGVYLLHPTHRSRSVPAGRVSGDIIMYRETSYWEPLGGHQGNIVICTCVSCTWTVCDMYMFQYNKTCLHQGPRDNSENIVTCIYNMYYVDLYEFLLHFTLSSVSLSILRKNMIVIELRLFLR